MTEQFSFCDIFRKHLDIKPGEQGIIKQILIPKIQRPYAQGRDDEMCLYVRTRFLEDIFTHLVEDKVMEMNFIYGIIRPDTAVFELLDGQQRITTLFLLHWYIANRELEPGCSEDRDIRQCLNHFSYETRATSAIFCHRLAEYHIKLGGHKPSEVLRSAKWYYKAFDRDSTIISMLNMLDAIDHHYSSTRLNNLFPRLPRLRFYVKSLGYFNLSEELYIKMNARGLQLSAFENFKADLSNYVSNHDDQERFNKLVPVFSQKNKEAVPFHVNFSVKLDAKWIDIFWNTGNKRFDAAYMNFFLRFFAIKRMITSDLTEKEIRGDEVLQRLYKDSDNISGDDYLGFGIFKEILDSNPDFIVHIESILDILFDYREIVANALVAAWDKKTDADADYIFCSPDRSTPLAKLATLGGAFEFLALTKWDYLSFARWMRMVNNIVENTNIDSITPVTSLVRKFSDIASHLAKETSAGKDYYSALASYSNRLRDNDNRAIREEIKKACLCSEDIRWEEALTEAENNQFLKGMVLFYYSDGITVDEFKSRTSNITLLFDHSGIAPEFRKDHLLIRAIMSRFFLWDQGDIFDRLKDKYITENAETNKYLKNNLANSNNVRAMLADVSTRPDIDAMKVALTEYIDSSVASIACDDSLESVAFAETRRRLCLDIDLYNAIAEMAPSGKCFRIYNFCGQYNVAPMYAQFQRFIIEAGKGRMGMRLCSEFGFRFQDENQKVVYEKYGDVNGTDFWLVKDIDADTTLSLDFATFRDLHISLHFSDETKASYVRNNYNEALHQEDTLNPCAVDIRPVKYVTEAYSWEHIATRIKDILDFFETQDTDANDR